MKKTLSIFLIAMITISMAACGSSENNTSQSTDPANSPMQESSGYGDDVESGNPVQPDDSSQEGEGVDSEYVKTDFTVEIYPAIDSTEPIDVSVSFAMDIPSDWVLEGDTTYQYIFNTDGDPDHTAAIIEGGRQVSDPEKPFDDVSEQFESTISMEEINIADYPVQRHIMDALEGGPSHYTYAYNVLVGDALVYIELYAPENTSDTQSKFDHMISTFVAV